MPPAVQQKFDWLSDISPALAAQESWRNGIYNEDSLFHLVYHTDAPFAISCGSGLLIEHVRNFRFSPEVVQRMSRITDDNGRARFDESFLNYLQRMRLRVRVALPPEGMLLLPDEPLAILRGPYAQIQLMESALRWLIWRSTQWATRVAQLRWQRADWPEEDTPSAPMASFDPDGWKIRAEYIGGGTADDILDTIREPSRMPLATEGLQCMWRTSHGPISTVEKAITQVRRVYKGDHVLGDIWLTDALEELASVSKTNASITDVRTHRHKSLKFTRFQHVYQPVLVKGHPSISLTRSSYLRQRTLKQLDAFQHANLDAYPHGWFFEN